MNDEINDKKKRRRRFLFDGSGFQGNKTTSEFLGSEENLKRIEFYSDEEKLLGSQLIDAARYIKKEELSELVGNPRTPVNFVDPETRTSALHFAGGRGSIDMINSLLRREEELNFLLRDRRGRLPSECAETIAGNDEVGSLLREKEIEQAKRIGATLKPRETRFADGSYDPPRESYDSEPDGPS